MGLIQMEDELGRSSEKLLEISNLVRFYQAEEFI